MKRQKPNGLLLRQISATTSKMSTNPSSKRPDQARASLKSERSSEQPNIGRVSLGCPKALVDSERILTRLRAEGYGISPDYSGADAVIVNTCGFLDSAKAESLDAIGEAINENGRVIVTGCLGAEPEFITGTHPRVLAVTGPHQYENVLDAVHQIVPPKPDPFIDLLPETGVKLTPRHFSYLKISEGCNHKCKFCIIPDMRGKLKSRPAHAIIHEATKLVDEVQAISFLVNPRDKQAICKALVALFAAIEYLQLTFLDICVSNLVTIAVSYTHLTLPTKRIV